jgi:F420H(2)-dependent biliverdin reductase
VAHDLADLGPGLLEFLGERHLATLTTLRDDGSPHVGKDPRAPRTSQARPGTLHEGHVTAVRDGRPRVAVCQVEGRRWVTLEGAAVVRDDAAAVADAVERYARRYRQPRENPARVVLEIAVDRILGNA